MHPTETAADLDRCVLRILGMRSRTVTYVIRNLLVMGAWSHKWRSQLRTARVLRACRRLELRGYVKEAPSVYAVDKCWAITETGRENLEVSEDEADKDKE